MTLRPFVPTALALLAFVAPAGAQLLEDLHRAVPWEGAESFVEAVDVDGDGALEVIRGADRLVLLRAVEGGGALVEDASAFPPTDRIGALATGDFDGNGTLDVVVTELVQFMTPRLQVFTNDGSGRFSLVSNAVPPTEYGKDSLAAGDLDGDGFVDFIATELRGFRPFWNDGTAHFSRGTTQGSDSGYGCALADVDGDADLDVVVASYSRLSRQSRVFENKGGRVFVEIVGALTPIPSSPASVATADIDGDGDLDLAFSGEGALYLGDGTGHFTAAAGTLPSGATVGASLQFVDHDGDGDPDLVHGMRPELFLNEGGVYTDASALVSPATSLRFTTSLAYGDLDQDGDADLYVGKHGSDRLLLGDPAGTLLDAQVHLPTEPWQAEDVLAHDLNGDGHVDLLQKASGAWNLWLGDGTGVFIDASGGLPPPTGLDVDLAAGDVDGDGDDDLFVAASVSQLLENLGNATFVDSSTSLPGIVLPTEAVELVDVDGNGTLDAVLGNLGAPNELWSNDGTGTFTSVPGTFAGLNDATVGVAVGDLDANGTPDVLFANSLPFVERLYLGDGSGGFVDATAQLPQVLFDTYDLALADFDRDGDLDVYLGEFVAGFNGGQPYPDRMYLNDGMAVFVDGPGRVPAVGTLAHEVTAADLDEDGDVDVLLANDDRLNFFDDAYFANDGSGFLADATSQIPRGSSPSHAVADLDHDGDLDVFDGRRVWSNITRHAAWAALPRIGQPLRLGVAGPPGEPWFLAGSQNRASIPLSFGLLGIDPSRIRLRGAGTLGAAGRGVLGIAVPPDPNLIGETLHWQALVGSPARFTNVETTTLTGR